MGSLSGFLFGGLSRGVDFGLADLRLRSHVLGYEFGGEAADGVRVHDDGLGIVLGLIACTAGLAGDDEDAFAAGGPVGGPFAGDLAVGDKTFRMADLVGGRIADHEMGVVCRWVLGDIGAEEGLFGLTAGLTFVEGDQHGNGRVHGLGEDDVVELLIVIAVHIEVQGDGDAGKDILEDIVDVVAADIEKMEHRTGVGVIGFFLCVLGQFADLEGGGEVLSGPEGVAGGLGVTGGFAC